MDTLDRLRKLLALAESPVEEEARSAALMAVRLIKEHKVILQLPATPITPTPVYTTALSYRFGKEPISLISKMEGMCAQCKGLFPKGTAIWWMKKHGATHYGCKTYWYKG